MRSRGLWIATMVVACLGFFAAPAVALNDGPTAITNDAQGVTYVGFGNSGQIDRFDANGNAMTSWNTGSGSTAALAVGPDGNIWAIDPLNVTEFTPSGSKIQSWLWNPNPPCAGDFEGYQPQKYGGIAVTSTNVFVTSPCFAYLMRFSLTGTLQQSLVLPSQPRGIAVGPAGSRTNQVFVALPDSHEVLTYNGSDFTTNSAEPPLLYNGFGSTNWAPYGVADKQDSGGDELVVSDSLNNYIYVYDPGHTWGTNGTYSEYRTLGHGTGSAVGSVNDPTAVSMHANDGSGLDTNLFIADYNNDRIQRWNDSGYAWWTAAAVDPGNGGGGGGGVPTISAPPSIGGTPTVGKSVTCSTGTWNGSPTSFAYTWADNGTTISGAISANYTIQSTDIGKSLTCSVIASNASGPSVAATSAAVTPAASPTAPQYGVPPSVTGTASPGGTLTCTNGTWSGTAPITYTYEWDRDGNAISNATGTTYVVAQGDVGHAITCRITGTNSVGSAQAVSNIVTPTAPASGPVGVSINAGATYTNNPAVTLTINPPAGTTSIIVSNDGGFTTTQTFAVAGNQYNWTLASTGSDRLPKTVYVRFVGSGDPADLTLTDDIVLDQTAPAVQSAVVFASGPSADIASVARAGKGSRGYVLRVKASDNNSGVGTMQYAPSKSLRSAKTVAYSRSVRVSSVRSARWVRVIDRAGNYGSWHRVRFL